MTKNFVLLNVVKLETLVVKQPRFENIMSLLLKTS